MGSQAIHRGLLTESNPAFESLACNVCYGKSKNQPCHIFEAVLDDAMAGSGVD
jgi:hypothetical protein